ncbi:hypothetical protein [Streptomyces sp. NPDC013181]|uniref:hypothetical protein n=1 Tax=Streptomyces sp. NPDC013181 TaxID=3364864 RepID=UPI00369E5C0F
MRTTPATPAEVESWLTVLYQHGHVHDARRGPDATWIVRRSPDSQPWTLHHPVLAMDWIENTVREIRQTRPEKHR